MAPLSKRIPREFKNNPGKWLGIIALLVLAIALVAGFLMASSSMQRILSTVDDDYRIEDGRFTANFPLQESSLEAIENTGATLYPNFSYDVNMALTSTDTPMTARIYQNRESIDLPAYFEGEQPREANEVALDRVFCNNNGIHVSDTVYLNGAPFTVSGIMSLSDYQALFEKNTDFVFNAQTFSVAQVSPEGLKTFNGASCAYTYSFIINDRGLSDAERSDFEKDMIDVIGDEGIALSEFLDRDANNGIGYALDDIEGDSVMWTVMLYLLIAILAFVFVVLTSSTIDEESAVIGTLLASGYRKSELVRHYLALPFVSGVLGALIGNVLGFGFLIESMSNLYYSSYSLPPYHTMWDWSVFVQSTLLPLGLLVAITLVGLLRKLRCTPLQFLRRETSKRSRKGGHKLPESLSFAQRFRLRVFGRNISHFVTLFAGIVFASLLLLFGFCVLPTVDSYASSLAKSLVANHTYLLKTPVELEGTLEQREQYAAALTLADTVDMSSIDEDEVEEKLTDVLKTRIENSVETQVESLFDENALAGVVRNKAAALIDEDRIKELALQGADVSAFANIAGSAAGTGTSNAVLENLSNSDVQALLDAGILKSSWIDLSYYGLPSISLLNLSRSSSFDALDSDALNWGHLVEAGIMRSSHIDLTPYGLGTIDLATFDQDNLSADDFDFDAIDFETIDFDEIGLGSLDLNGLSKNEFMSLLRKASQIDEDANVVNTVDNGSENIAQAEKFTAASLEYDRGEDAGWEAVTLYGVQPNSRYYTDLPLAAMGSAAASDAADNASGTAAAADSSAQSSTTESNGAPSTSCVTAGLGLTMKFGLKVGDTFELYDKYENKTYAFTVGAIWGSDGNMNVYAPFNDVNALVENDADFFSGYLSNEVLTFDERYLASDMTPEQMDKIGAQMESSMGDMMYLLVGISVAIYLILMYLLTKTIIERSARHISYMKVFGYSNAQINKLYLRSISEVVIASLVLAVPVVVELISLLVKVVFMHYSGNFVVALPFDRIALEIVLGVACYAVVAFLHMRRIKNVPLALALKTQE